MDFVEQIKELQERAEHLAAQEKKYFKLFELAGVDLYIEPDDEGKSRPKELEELIADVLQNPPEEPQRWIRIQDIPRYINDFVYFPEKAVIEEFNNAAPAKTQTKRTKPRGSYMDQSEDALDDIQPEDDPLPEGRNVNDQGELEPEVERTGQQWAKAGYVPVGTTVIDEIGVIWYKHGKNEWINISAYQEGDVIDMDIDADVTAGGPLYETVEGANVQLDS